LKHVFASSQSSARARADLEERGKELSAELSAKAALESKVLNLQQAVQEMTDAAQSQAKVAQELRESARAAKQASDNAYAKVLYSLVLSF
jgi:hypothetical protein